MSDIFKECGRICLFVVSLFGTLASFFALKFSMMLIFFCFLIISIVLLVRAALQNKKKKHEDELQSHLMKANNQIPIFEAFGVHINGLPIPPRMQIKLTVFRGMIFINNMIHVDSFGIQKQFGTFEFKIPIEKLISMDVVTQSQIEYIQKQSLSRAVTGGLLFGDVGALLGGMPQSKKIEHIEKFLAISYESENKIQIIILQIPQPEKAIASTNQYISFRHKSIEL